MSAELEKVLYQIQLEKRRLGELYESRGKTDSEILKLGNKLDRLINKHARLVKNFG